MAACPKSQNSLCSHYFIVAVRLHVAKLFVDIHRLVGDRDPRGAVAKWTRICRMSI